MNEALLRYATKTIWCSPDQDQQFVYKLSRVGSPDGNTKSFWTPMERIGLPDTNHVWQVYQIGAVATRNLNVPKERFKWHRLDTLAKERLLFTNLYTEDGVQFPRFEAYCALLHGDGLFIAVRQNDRVGNLKKKDLYARFYTNAYFGSERSASNRWLEIIGQRFLTANDILLFQRHLEDRLASFKGPVYYLVNGRFVHNVSPVTCSEGDVAEVILDPSIAHVEDLAIKDLPAFTSILDQRRKYLLHHQTAVGHIEYCDDIDVYLYKQSGIRLDGVYYHRNDAQGIRMVTHRDYSIPVDRVRAFKDAHTTPNMFLNDIANHAETQWGDVNELRVRLYIRNSGLERPLQAESHRIQELYRLSDQAVLEAMVGMRSTIAEWKAEALENSPYCRFMAKPSSFVMPIFLNDPTRTSESKLKAQELVGDVFGYHAAAKLMANSPLTPATTSSTKMFELGFEHYDDSTVFEYSKEGLFLEAHYNVRGQYYLPRNSQTELVEVISGKAGDSLSEIYGNARVKLPEGYNYRLYVNSVWAGETVGTWKDITHDTNLSSYGEIQHDDNGVRYWVWKLDAKSQYGLVRTDETFVFHTETIPTDKGVLQFTVNDTINNQKSIMSLVPAVLDVWLNGRTLQEGLDYVVQWPKVVISNREYLDLNAKEQVIQYRAYGLPTDQNARQDYVSTGFVKYGVLSHNGRFDLHRNKVQRIIIDGRLTTEDRVTMDEDTNNTVSPSFRNGAPYSIETPPVIFHTVYDDDYDARLKDDAIEKHISDYLTSTLPSTERPVADMIEYRYSITSCFANKVLTDLKSGTLKPTGLDGHYSEQFIRETLASYEWLLPFDLCQTEYDKAYVTIQPGWADGPVELPYYQYTFFVRAMMLYLRHVPDHSKYLKVGGV